ncbi:hypothetical protein ACQ4PT_071583 [Festuca glaucescens]
MAGTCAHVEFLRAQPAWALALAAVGLFVAVRAALRLALWVYAFFLRPGKPLRRRYGPWAVVTGGTDGIGRAIAFRLAASGLNLVLVGRSPDKLSAVSDEIRAKHPKTEVRTFVLDFACEGLVAGVEALKESIRGLDVGVLVNNAGLSYPYARYFHEVDEELMRNLIQVNVEAVTRITHAVLPGMVDRKRGAIVNIGSGAASVVPSDPLYSVYAATKASVLSHFLLEITALFALYISQYATGLVNAEVEATLYVDQFSRCLYVEYKGKGIDVQCQGALVCGNKDGINQEIFLPCAIC